MQIARDEQLVKTELPPNYPLPASRKGRTREKIVRNNRAVRCVDKTSCTRYGGATQRKRNRVRIKRRKKRHGEPARYLSPREPVTVFEMSVESAAGLTLRGGRAGAGAWLEDEVETGPMTPTLPPRTPSSAECCLEDCELCDNQRRPPVLVTTVAPVDPATWWGTAGPPSSDVLCDQKFKSTIFVSDCCDCNHENGSVQALRWSEMSRTRDWNIVWMKYVV